MLVYAKQDDANSPDASRPSFYPKYEHQEWNNNLLADHCVLAFNQDAMLVGPLPSPIHRLAASDEEMDRCSELISAWPAEV